MSEDSRGVASSVMSSPLAKGDDARTAQVIAAMFAMVQGTDFANDVATLAKRLGWTRKRKDFRDQLRNVFDWLRSDRFRFKRDTWAREVVNDPTILVREVETRGRPVAVDCDDIATLGAALVRAMGFRPILITTAKTPESAWGHVFYGVTIDGRDIPFDPQESRVPFVWTRQPGVDRVGVWEYDAPNPNRPRTPRI